MDRLDQALTHVRTELGRADAKAFGLLALAGTALSAGLAVLGTGRLTGAAAVTGWTAVALLIAGVFALADAVRPRLAGGYGFMTWANPGEDLAALLDDDACRVAELRALSAAARAKYRRVQVGMGLLGAGLAAAIVTAILHSQH